MKHIWLACVLFLNATDYLNPQTQDAAKQKVVQEITQNGLMPSSLAISGGTITADIISIALSLNDEKEKTRLMPKTTPYSQAEALRAAQAILADGGTSFRKPLNRLVLEALDKIEQKKSTQT